MALLNVVWMLTALAGVVVLITRSRLRATEAQSGVTDIPSTIINAHTIIGIATLAVWIWWLTGGPHLAGYIAVGLWWLLTLIGLLILGRWLPSHGNHSNPSTDDTLSRGPGLSILGHL